MNGMNSTRIVVFSVLFLLVGILVGFGFRGSIAGILELDAITPTTKSGISVNQNQMVNLVDLMKGDYSALYDDLESVKIPAQLVLTEQGRAKVPSNLKKRPFYFDFASMTGYEKKGLDDCLSADPTKTISDCLVSEIIKKRATAAPITTE